MDIPTTREVAEILQELDDLVDQWAFYELLSGSPLRPLTIAGYRRALKEYTIGEIAAGRYGAEQLDPPRPPH